jgi:hypothetical protein
MNRPLSRDAREPPGTGGGPDEDDLTMSQDATASSGAAWATTRPDGS